MENIKDWYKIHNYICGETRVESNKKKQMIKATKMEHLKKDCRSDPERSKENPSRPSKVQDIVK